MAHDCTPSIRTPLPDLGQLSATGDTAASGRLRKIADEQAALQRIATLVARGVRPDLVFAAVAREVRHVLPSVDFTMVGRYDHDHAVEVVGGWSRTDSTLLTAHRPRLPDAAGAIAMANREIGIRSSVGAPINVDGRAWGVLLVGSTHEDGIPTGTGHRLTAFTELVATAIANAQAREELRAIADDQAAVRRFAALVARGEPPQSVYAAVAEEVGRLLPDAETVILARQDPHLPDGQVTEVSTWSRPGNPARDAGIASGGVATLVVQTGRPARMDSYADTRGSGDGPHTKTVSSAVGAPIGVDGRVWGVMLATSTRERPLPATTEGRLATLTELATPVIAHAHGREQPRTFADERAALRRVAQLIADAPPATVFTTVTDEVGRLLRATWTSVTRYNPDGTVTEMAGWSNATDPGHDAPEPERTRVVAPIDVANRRWGALIASTDTTLPADARTRLAGFAELLAAAIATTEARAELRASRARALARVDQMRRRIERDLHDGAQQRLVSLALQLRTAQAAVPPGLDTLAGALDQVITGLTGALDELREYGRGIHPAILSEGLGPALKALGRRSPVPVELDLGTDMRLPENIEVAAYYVVSEALTNVAKHAQASHVAVTVAATADTLYVTIRDDGTGGADFARGTGLIGLKDRAEALGGAIVIHSPPGSGTTLRAELPLVRIDHGISAVS